MCDVVGCETNGTILDEFGNYHCESCYEQAVQDGTWESEESKSASNIEGNPPRKYDITDQDEIKRLYRELYGYLKVCQECGGDFKGRYFALEALDKLKDIGGAIVTVKLLIDRKIEGLHRRRIVVNNVVVGWLHRVKNTWETKPNMIGQLWKLKEDLKFNNLKEAKKHIESLGG